MKNFPFVSSSLLAASLLLAGCGDSSSTNKKSRNVGDQYLRSTLNQRSQAQSIIGVTAYNQAIQLFHVQHGRYPATLQELKEKGFINQIPSSPQGQEFAYDASSGRVTVKAK